MAAEADNGPKVPGRETRPALPKRFYKAVTVSPSPRVQGEGTESAGFQILLDGKPIRTPAKALLAVPTRALADAIAAEWQAQGDRIDPATMPLTRLANSAIDGVRGREAEVRADIVKYAAGDLLCYRACEPEALVRRQAELWDPILAWSREALAAPFAVAQGIMPVAQSDAATQAVARAFVGYDPFALCAVHVMTTLMGSALLALAHAGGWLSAAAAWATAHVEEDWQIGTWGEDAEAAARRQRRWSEMQAASRMLEALRSA
jgi:chaperone required for assembly of F1-ATPase